MGNSNQLFWNTVLETRNHKKFGRFGHEFPCPNRLHHLADGFWSCLPPTSGPCELQKGPLVVSRIQIIRSLSCDALLRTWCAWHTWRYSKARNPADQARLSTSKVKYAPSNSNKCTELLSAKQVCISLYGSASKPLYPCSSHQNSW